MLERALTLSHRTVGRTLINTDMHAQQQKHPAPCCPAPPTVMMRPDRMTQLAIQLTITKVLSSLSNNLAASTSP